MESGTDGASSQGALISVLEASDDFRKSVLAPLRSSYLYEESKQCFRYDSACLIKNPALEEKYNTFRVNKGQTGYSEEELEETFGFLLFDNVDKALELGKTGVLTGNSTCTTLGDPSKGVYISMYSDCLDLNRWYHGKSGYIAIVRLTKGRVKKISENYTQNFTAPTAGFDCHVSEELPSVSSKTSSFLAFERTQYYSYELQEDGSNEAAQSPSLACPFAIVSFSYTDSKETVLAPQEKSEEKRQASCYLPWKGQLQIGITCYSVVLKSPVGALIPTKLPPVVKVERAISMSDLRRLVPKTIFESSFSGEVCLEGLYYNLYKLVSSVEGKTSSLSELLREIKENDVALTVPLKDGGFLVLLHDSHFFQYDDSGTSSEVLQGVFVFPESQCIRKDIKIRESEPWGISSEVLQILPVLSYAEGEVEKMQTDVNEELCDVVAQHMESYAALINPGLTLSPMREVSMFPDHYEVPGAHKHLYLSPEWTKKELESLQSYVSKPVSFQLPVSKASEILAVGQQEEREDLDDDVYICPSSPEAEPDDTFGVGTIGQLAGQKSDHDTSVDSCLTRTVAELDLAEVPQKISNYAKVDDANKEAHKSDLTVLVKTDDMGVGSPLAPPLAHDLPAELIVSITSAQTVTNESLSVISMETKENDLELPTFSAAKSQTSDVNSLNEETVKQTGNQAKRRWRRKRRGRFRGRKKAPKSPVSTLSSEPKEDVNVQVEEDVKAPESPGQLQQSKDMTDDTTKVAPEVAVESSTDSGKRTLGSTILIQLEACRLRKKTERWDLKPVISQCGRILVPHGSSDIVDQIKHLKERLVSTKDEQLPEKIQVDVPPKAQDTVEMEEMPSTAPESVDEVEEIKAKDDGNHLQTVVSHVNPDNATSTQSNESKGSVKMNPDTCEDLSKNGTTDTSPSEAVKEKHTPTISLGDCTSKNEFLWYKLKHFISSGKRKTDLISDECSTDFTQDMEPYSKKSKGSSGPEMLKSSDTITDILDSNVGVMEGPKAPSVDPLFALALGLTPKGIQNVQQRENSTGTQERIILDKTPQIIQRPLSINPKRTRVKALKTLKKHQGVSTEHVKEKWWLHFQTPACISSENRKCSRDYSVSKTVKEKMHTACRSTDALNLLADLALIANNDQGQPQLDPERKQESSSDKCDMSTEQESVLHTLLRQPVARPLQLPEAGSQSCPVEGNELIDLVSEEHAYSLHPCASLLLGLPGAPFQVSPLSGSTRVLHHHHTMCGNGIQTLLPSVGPQVRGEHKHKTQEHLKKHLQFRRNFGHFRRFVESDGSIKVTRRWKENYDFSLDSKFSTDSKDRTIIRALHGPWDVSIKDTPEEVQLIVHMWIGLFYSRSTARFFDYDSSLFCSEESKTLEKSTHAQSDLDVKAPLSLPDMINLSLAKTLDLSKNDVPSMEQETKALDLSLRDPNTDIATTDLQVNKKETSVSGEQKDANVSSSSPELPSVKESPTFQDCSKATLPAKIISEMDVFRNNYKNKRTCLQKAGQLEDTSGACKVYGTESPVQEMRENVPEAPKTQTVTALEHVLHGSNNEKRDMEDGIENSGEKMNLEKCGAESSKSTTDNEVNSNKEDGGVVFTGEPDESGFRHVKNGTVEEGSSEEKPIALSWNGLHSEDVSRKTESGIVSCGNHLEHSSWKKAGDISDTVSCDYVRNVRKGEDCSLAYDKKVSKAPFEKNGNVPDERDIHFIPALSGLSDKLSPAIRDSSDSSTKECNHPTPLDEQSPKTETANGACGVQSKMPCPNGTSLTKEQNGSEKAPHPSMDVDHSQNEPSVVKNSGDVFWGNGVSCKKSADFIAAEEKTGSTTQKEPSPHKARAPQSEVAGKVEPEVPLSEEKVHSSDGTHEELEKAYCGVVIPFIGRDLSGENILEPVHSPKKEEDVKKGKDPSQRDKQFISDITNHKVISSIKGHSLMKMYRKKAELPPCQTHLLDVSQTSHQIDNRSPAPPIDEKTWNSVPCSGSSALSGSETCQNVEKCPRRSLTPANEKKPCATSALNSHPERHHDLHLRTLRVLQSLDRFFSKSDEIDTDDLKRSLDETSNLSTNIPLKPVMVLAPKEHRERTESSDYLQKAPFTNKLEKVLGVKLQFKKTDSLVQYFERPDTLQDISDGQDLHPLKYVPLTECLEAKMDQVRQKIPSQANLSESRSNSLRPVMAVKPSKSDDGFMEEGHTEKSAMLTSSKNVNTVVTNTTPTSTNSEREMDCLKGNSEPLSDHLKGVKELCSRDSWSWKENPSVSSTDGVVSCQAPTSAYSAQCSDSATISPGFDDGKQNGPSSVEKVEQTPKKDKKTEPEGSSDALDSTLDHGDDMTDESLILGPDHSIMCTIYNTSQKLSLSFLEQISKRCLQENLTQASMEQECLIFLEKMKQLLKRKKGKPSSEEDIHNQLPCLSPLTVSFFGLGEQEDSLEDMDAITLGRKIKVDMSDRDIATENKKTLHDQRSAPGGDKPAEHDGVSSAAAKCATLYMAMMTDVCAGKKTQCSHTSIRDEIYPKTESGSHFDFCDSMKRKLDESFRSNLNSVVKKSCKRKYRFYILETSDDSFFEETRALLEAEGHTSVESPDLLLSEDSSSSQLIILRNEDIAEHICEVPHLLELKKSPGVQFVGIDEPDDVVNLTYQELFFRGGFIMLDTATLESLSLSNLNKMSEILKELSRTGKWKWVLHYRDSRRLKENARLSAEAKAKNIFLNCCKDDGLLEVMPYHECDRMSRDQPEYLTCLARLQIQNISARYPVLVTDTNAEDEFEKNGILTININTLLTGQFAV